MIVGKMLKEKYGFDSNAVIEEFCSKYGYSEKFIRDVLEDRWDSLMMCHIDDLMDYTKIELELIMEWHDLGPKASESFIPMGRPYHNELANLVEVDLTPFEPKLFITTRPEGNAVRAGFFPNPGEEEFKPGPDDLTPRALELLKTIGFSPITIKKSEELNPEEIDTLYYHHIDPLPGMGILDYINQLSLARRNEDVPEASQEQMQALFNRVKERYKTNPVHIRSELTIKDLPDPESIDIHGYPSVTGVGFKPDPQTHTAWDVVTPKPEVGYAMVPLELLETLADIASDEGFSIPANKAYDIINAVKGE